jgi:hypothetical protein
MHNFRATHVMVLLILAAGLVATAGCHKTVTVYVRNQSDQPMDISVQKLGQRETRELGRAEPKQALEFSLAVPYDELPSTYQIRWVSPGLMGEEARRATSIMIQRSTKTPLRVNLPSGMYEEPGL